MLALVFLSGIVVFLLSRGSYEWFELMLLGCGSSLCSRWSRVGRYSVDLAIGEPKELLTELARGHLCYNGLFCGGCRGEEEDVNERVSDGEEAGGFSVLSFACSLYHSLLPCPLVLL